MTDENKNAVTTGRREYREGNQRLRRTLSGRENKRRNQVDHVEHLKNDSDTATVLKTRLNGNIRTDVCRKIEIKYYLCVPCVQQAWIQWMEIPDSCSLLS